MFDYTLITDRLRAISLSNNSHPTDEVNLRFKDLTFLLPATAAQSKRQISKNLQINLHIETEDQQSSKEVIEMYNTNINGMFMGALLKKSTTFQRNT